ncbi:sensor histidine kinase [Halomonas sp. 328]|uniref:sensor histidine kinase n=1 Tax=Halomonas sp. 328 TaxID=2776704 RepID=UPI0018A72F9F|nr:PAS domain-containing sensor histidine kinase [Halomonas sp. 328]MBF8221098.1 two-component sensor histidine kinase [Halomonas sp. 328]
MRLRRPAYVLPGLAILAFATFLSLALVRLFLVEQDMRDNVDENMLWVMTQAQVAGHHLDGEVNRRLLGDPEADPALRFDVLTSRLVLLDAGPQRRYLEEIGFADRLDRSLQHLEAIEPLLDTLEPRVPASGEAIHGHLEPLMAQLNRIANAVMVQEWEATGARLDTHRRNMLQAIASILGILASGLVLVALLVQALRQRRAAQRALARHRDELELEVQRRTRDLETERQRVVAAIDTAPDGFAAFDEQGRLVLANPQLGELLPLPASRLAKDQPLPGLMGAIREAARREETECDSLDQGERGALQCDLEFEGRGWRQLMLRSTQGGGQVLRVADITRYKAAAQALERSLQRERGVSDFYRSFAGMVSHQFRTPLAVIDSGLQRLLRRGERMSADERARRYLGLREAVDQMTRLVESSLTAARLDGGQVEANPESCDLVPLAEQACRLQQEANDHPHIQVSTTARPLLAWCDRALVEQVLANLLSNAIKYSPRGGTIRVTLGREEERLYCRVQDHGIGIAPDDLPRVFERFFRSRHAAGTPGVGLGLNISRHLARIQGGEVTAESEKGLGATFTLWLPATQGRHDHADPDR